MSGLYSINLQMNTLFMSNKKKKFTMYDQLLIKRRDLTGETSQQKKKKRRCFQ